MENCTPLKFEKQGIFLFNNSGNPVNSSIHYNL